MAIHQNKTIWPMKVQGKNIKPRDLLAGEAKKLNPSGGYSASISPERKGKNGQKRTNLVLETPSGHANVVATVEYPSAGYPATLILGRDRDPIFFQLSIRRKNYIKNSVDI